MRNFKEFIKERIVKEQKPDKSRAEYLINESLKSYNLLLKKIEKIGVDNDTANDFIKNCYDIIMELIRAKMLLDGYNASSFSAHEAEVSYLTMLRFNEKDVQFLDQLRYFRNGIIYYGTNLNKEYAKKVIEFTKRIYAKLRQILNN